MCDAIPTKIGSIRQLIIVTRACHRLVPRAGTYIASELREGLTVIHCRKCGRAGRYRRETPLWRFGSDTPLPHIPGKLADWPASTHPERSCGVVYSEPLG